MSTQPERRHAETGDTTWDGAVARCHVCHGLCDYLKDVDHDDGSCEVFRCRDCGTSFHVELPD